MAYLEIHLTAVPSLNILDGADALGFDVPLADHDVANDEGRLFGQVDLFLAFDVYCTARSIFIYDFHLFARKLLRTGHYSLTFKIFSLYAKTGNWRVMGDQLTKVTKLGCYELVCFT